MAGPIRTRWIPALLLAAAGLFPRAAAAHPGSGIVVDRLGRVYFVDMVSGIWRLDPSGTLTQLPGPAFHWMTLDAEGRFAATRLPSGSGGDFARIGSSPTVLLASDFPIALGRDGNLYYPSHGSGPLQILRLSPAGESSVFATLPPRAAHGPLRWLNGLAAAPDGTLYYTEDDAVRRVSREGRVSTVVENLVPPGCAPRRPLLRGLDVAADGVVYVADAGCGYALRLTPAGQVTILPEVHVPWFPTGVALAGNDLYVLEFENPDTDDRRAMIPRVRLISLTGGTRVVATVSRVP